VSAFGWPDTAQLAGVLELLDVALDGPCGDARDLLIMSRRDFCGPSNREIGHRLGYADGATVGKRFAQLSCDSDLHHGIQKAAAKVKNRSIDNCKGPEENTKKTKGPFPHFCD
jgi:hypothetical protein